MKIFLLNSTLLSFLMASACSSTSQTVSEQKILDELPSHLEELGGQPCTTESSTFKKHQDPLHSDHYLEKKVLSRCGSIQSESTVLFKNGKDTKILEIIIRPVSSI